MSNPRVVLPATPHHVVLRANNRRRLFSYPREYQQFVFLLARALKGSGCALHAAALMTNHVHLLVTPPTEAALPRLVKSVAQRYAQLRNRERGGSGHLFEQRYFSRPILTEEQVAIVTAYIELNPVRAGLVEDPRAYRWSTCGWHVDGVCDLPRVLWSPTDWYLSLERSRAWRAARYGEWIDECLERARKPDQVTNGELRAVFASRRARLERPDRSSAA